MASRIVCEWSLFSHISNLDVVLVSVALPTSPINGLEHQTDSTLAKSHPTSGNDYRTL